MPSAVGRRVPLSCTALGKVLLSGMDPEDAKNTVRGSHLPALTENSITDPGQLLEVVARARENGYALDQQEIEMGLLCVAAPVRDDTGAICAGISISAPLGRAEPQLDRYIGIVKTTAATLSRQLGPRARTLRHASPHPQ
jgi:DNA-binding IclR family transcriptional regulator